MRCNGPSNSSSSNGWAGSGSILKDWKEFGGPKNLTTFVFFRIFVHLALLEGGDLKPRIRCAPLRGDNTLRPPNACFSFVL